MVILRSWMSLNQDKTLQKVFAITPTDHGVNYRYMINIKYTSNVAFNNSKL